MNQETVARIEEIIVWHQHTIAGEIYPTIPPGNGELTFMVGTEDGEFPEKIQASDITWASIHFINAVRRKEPAALCQAALAIARNTQLRARIINSDADNYYESDGHYETGNTKEKNRQRFAEQFPSVAEFRAFYKMHGDRV